MNTQAFEQGKAAYQQGNFAQAATLLSEARQPGEVSGQIDHLLGNCYMRMGRYDEAAHCYAQAAGDASYGHAGALACNRGRALSAAGKPQEAIASLTMATKDASYATPYKAYLALGAAYMALGDARDAGVAYRNAAIDESNPNPTGALTKLGDCFMRLGRSVDAIEAYRTSLDFAAPTDDSNAIYAALGLAYVAANRMSEATSAFAQATSDGAYQLSAEQRAAYDAARKALASQAAGGPSETDALLAAAGYGSAKSQTAAVDPLDPLGKSGELIPSPEDTGFFSVSEDEIVEADKRNRKVRRKHRHTGLRVFLVLLLIVLLLCGAGAYAYYRGYGWPTAESVATEVIEDNADGNDVSKLLAGSLKSDKRDQIMSNLPTGVSSVEVKGVDREMNKSEVGVQATLDAGGTVSYTVELVRDGISWKVVDVTPYAPSAGTSEVSFAQGTDEAGADQAAAPAEAPAEGSAA